MRFLPVVERELRVTSRSARLYWGRFIAALIAIAIVTWIWTVLGPGQSSDARARQIFTALGSFALLYSLICGVLITADSISEEKREGTLGLLFLTNLRGYDVILGKLFASSLHSIYSLFAILPVLAIPILLGGVTVGEYWRIAAVLVISLLFSLATGIFTSVLSRHDRKAQFATFILVAICALLAPSFGLWLARELHWSELEIFYYVSPVYAYIQAFDAQYKGYSDQFWTSLLTITGLSVLELVIAGLIVPRVWQDRPKAGGPFRHAQPLQRLFQGSVQARCEYRARLLDQNAFFWLSARDRFKPFYVLGFLVFAAGCWLVLYWKYGNEMLDNDAFLLSAIPLHTVLKLWLASEAGRIFAEERKSGALELTLSTPLSVRDILEGQFLALFRQFGWAIGVLLVFDLAALVIGARGLGGSDAEWIVLCLVGMIVLVADCFAIATLGMWLGLRGKRTSRAFSQTVFQVLLLPWVVLFGLLMLVSITDVGPRSANSFFGAYFIVSVGIDFFLFTWASGNLTSRFREVATSRFDAPR